MTKIYDCFTFYNEFEILDLRIAEIYNHVDHMILVEADHTFQNTPKEFNFEKVKDKYSHLDKLIYIQVKDMPLDADAWQNERWQRDCILRGLTSASDDDLIIISDIDEILRPDTITNLKNSEANIFGFRMPLFNFKFNYMLSTQDFYSVWSGAIRKKLLNSPEDFRRQRHALNTLSHNYNDGNIQIIEHAGWHFTYLGDDDFAKNKIQSFAHSDANHPDFLNQINIEESISLGRGIKVDDADYLFTPVLVDDYLPTTIVENVENYKKFILPDAKISAKALLEK